MEHHKKMVQDHCVHGAMDPLFQQEQGSEILRESARNRQDLFMTGADTKRLGHQNKRERRKGAARMAGSMFWANLAGVILLVIGCYSSGWLTIKVTQEMHYSTYSYDGDQLKVRNSYVFQDYGLWYITQCNDPGIEPVCKVLSYRVIDAVYDRKCRRYHDCVKIQIGEIERTEKSQFLIFSGAALVFSYSEFVRMQTLYTLGLLLSICTLYYWYLFRKDVAEDITFSRKMWVFLLLLAVLSAVFALVPVFMFFSIHVQIKDGYEENVKSPVGLAFAGSGGGFMTLVSVLIFMQLICCRNEDDVYICSCLVETEVQVPQREEDF